MTHEDAGAKSSQAMLVIDDDEVSLAVLTVQLQAEGFTVFPAASGEQAIEKMRELPREALPFAVLADLNMPGLSGRELAEALHQTLPHAKLLAISATAAAIDGYDGFVSKPLEIAALRAALAALPPAPAIEAKDAPPLREEVYAKLLKIMPRTALEDVYAICLSDTRQRVTQMQRLAAESDFAGVQRQAHTVKGGAAMVGAAQLAAAAAWLETGRYEKADVLELIHNLLTYCDELQRILQRKINL